MTEARRPDLESSLFWELWKHSPDNMFILRVAPDDFYIMNTNLAQREVIEELRDGSRTGQPLASVLPPEFYNLVAPNYRRCITVRESIQYEESEQFTSNEVRYWSTMLCPILNHEGEVAFIFGISRNITALKRAQSRAEKAAEEAERANRIKTAFLANMSHEMRTPLNGIKASAELLAGAIDEAERQALCNLITQATEALTRLTSDILDYARIDAGHLKLEKKPFVLADVVTDVHQLLRATAETRGLDFSWILPRLPARGFQGDAGRLKQVLLNLAGNALKFTEQGSVTIHCQFLGYQETRVLLQFEVQDTGIGIAAEDLARLFQPFSQVDDSTTRRYQGSGLGLAISKDLVEKMGGSICVRSEPGVGSCFSFSIPFEPCMDACCGQAHDTVQEERPVAGLRVLLVEDNPINQMVTRKLLEKSGIVVTVAENGVQALDACRDMLFDAVLMDWHMPVMDGLDATREIRQLIGERALVPVIGLTASALPDDRNICLNAGMNEVITKPVNARLLIKTLGDLARSSLH